MTSQVSAYTSRQIHFATLAIGATAKQIGVSSTEVFNRLKRHDLIKKLLFDCYDTLHAESIEGVVTSPLTGIGRKELDFSVCVIRASGVRQLPINA